MTNSASTPALSLPAPVVQYLDENDLLVEAIKQNQNLGRLHECVQYQLQLQQNLVHLAMHAEDQFRQRAAHARDGDYEQRVAVPHEHGARADERARAGPRGPGALAPDLQRARSEFRQLAPCLREGLEEFFGARLERYVTSRKQRVKSVALKYKCKMTN